MPLLSIKITDAAMADLKREAQVTGIGVSELVRQKLEITPGQLVHDSDDRYVDFERRLSRLEEMAGL